MRVVLRWVTFRNSWLTRLKKNPKTLKASFIIKHTYIVSTRWIFLFLHGAHLHDNSTKTGDFPKVVVLFGFK